MSREHQPSAVSSDASKVAIVTGGGSGIGLALAEGLLREGVCTWIVGRTAATLERARESLSALGHVYTAAGDVTDADFLEALVKGVVSARGRLDYLFNNAGVALAGQVQDLSLEDWRRVLDTNLYGVVHGIAAAYPVMCQQRFGHIVNVSSLAGVVAMPGLAPYVASKHAVVGLSLALRAEAELHGVRVSVACPAGVSTPATQRDSSVNLDERWMRDQVRFPSITPGECAECILRGVKANRAMIMPGPAARVAFVARHAPWFARHMARSFGRVVSEARARYLSSRPAPSLES